MRVIAVIRYYNVWFYLTLWNERERSWFSLLEERISTGEQMVMKDIYRCCDSHRVQYRTRFCYRLDFSVTANLWNFYSYLWGRIDMGRMGRGTVDV